MLLVVGPNDVIIFPPKLGSGRDRVFEPVGIAIDRVSAVGVTDERTTNGGEVLGGVQNKGARPRGLLRHTFQLRHPHRLHRLVNPVPRPIASHCLPCLHCTQHASAGQRE